MENSLINVMQLYNSFFIIYMFSLNTIYFIILFFATINLFLYKKKSRYMDYVSILSSKFTPGVSILVPCYNEENTIVQNVKSLINLEYGEYEVIVISDGSIDKTLVNLIENFELEEVDTVYKSTLKTKEIKRIYLSKIFKNLIVIDKENGGKADALNAGLNISVNPLFIAVDADSMMEKNSLLKIVWPFIYDFKNTVAAGGIVMIMNGCKITEGFLEDVKMPGNFLAKMQVVEYLRAFLSGRLGWSLINSLLIVSGAFGIFKKDAIVDIGGYTANTIGEDMELIMRVHKSMMDKKKKYKVVFVPDPVCWTQCPEDIKSLYTQRKRWQRGLMDSLFSNYKMLMNPKYKVLGLITIPYHVIFELIEPVVSFLGYMVLLGLFVLGSISKEAFITFFLVVILYGIFMTIFSVLLGEYAFKRYERVSDFFMLILCCVLENFGYRQINSFWRFRAMIGYRFKKNTWGTIGRQKIG